MSLHTTESMDTLLAAALGEDDLDQALQAYKNDPPIDSLGNHEPADLKGELQTDTFGFFKTWVIKEAATT